MSEAAIPEDLKIKCVLCKGVGHKERTSFSSPGTMRMVSCHACKGTGKVWAFDQQQMAERIAAAEAQIKLLRTALDEAAQSLNSIATQAGKDEYMKDVYQIRGYANSRTTVARAALKGTQ